MVDSQVDNVTSGVLGGGVARVVNGEDVVAEATSQENPVTAVVDVGDQTVTSREAVAHLSVGGVLLAHVGGVAELVNTAPVDGAAVGVATVGLQPGVQGTRVLGAAAVVEVHGDGGHGAASRADGLTAGAELVAAPSTVALLPEDITGDYKNK